MANPDLPEDILLEIFSRIPARLVGKCRTLSKSWKINLSTNGFIKKHLTTRKQTIQQEHLALVTQQEQLYIITSPTKNDEVFDDKSYTGEWFYVIGSCNGLILVNIGGELILVNPVTRKQVTIPPQVHEDSRQCCVYERGFGYDACSDDFKIVEISCYQSKNGAPAKTVVDVYSVKNGVWETLDDGCYPFGGFVPKTYAYEGGAFVNGALHWLICGTGGYRICIAAFDLSSKVFRHIPLPKNFVRPLWRASDFINRPRRSNGVVVVGGCLLIVENHGNGDTDVWIMKEYGVAESWVMFRIQSEEGDDDWNSIVAILCYVEDGELLCMTSEDLLFACDLKGGAVRKVELGGRNDRYGHGVAFVDSLVSPEGYP